MWLSRESEDSLYLEYSVSTSMHLIGLLQVPKCDSDLIQLMQVFICRNLQVYTETHLTSLLLRAS